MKYYATIESERGKPVGKGGQRFLKITITREEDGERVPINRVEVMQAGVHVLDLQNGEVVYKG